MHSHARPHPRVARAHARTRKHAENNVQHLLRFHSIKGFRERASVSRYTYIACLLIYISQYEKLFFVKHFRQISKYCLKICTLDVIHKFFSTSTLHVALSLFNDRLRISSLSVQLLQKCRVERFKILFHQAAKKCRGAQISAATSPGRVKILRWCQISMAPQFCHLDFEVAARFLEKIVDA
jgi:hypothetical protein